MIVSPQPTVKRTETVPPSRTLAYQQQIARPDGGAEGNTPQEHATAPADAVPVATTPEPDAEDAGSSDVAALPPEEGAEVAVPDALPWQRAGSPHGAAPGGGADAFDPMAAGEDGDPSAPMAALPGEDADPNAWPAGPQDEPQEWAQVLVSGIGMYGTPSDDAPMLFAFPYGRTLRVVSRYEGWVEVTDPQSAATGWMKAQYLTPTAAPGTRQEAEQMQEAEGMYDDQPRWRSRRWLRRHGGGLGDIIGRALGGY